MTCHLGDDDPVLVRQRQSTTFNNNYKGHFSFQQKEPHRAFNKNQGDMILSHKFEYGYNEEGGRKWASKESLQRESIQDS